MSGNEYGEVDTRVVLQVYAALAGLGGLLLCGWGTLWALDALFFSGLAMIRVFGSILLGAACCAMGLAGIQDPQAQRRGLLWFAAGHAAVASVLVWQQVAGVWGSETAERAAQGMVWVTASLLVFWIMAGREYAAPVLQTVFGGNSPGAAEGLHSRYEQKIREAAAQEERNRLARELHDSIKQQLFVIQTAAATAQTRITGDTSGAQEALQQVRASARDAMTEMEVMLDQLRAEPLENAGLVAALKKQCEALGFRTGAAVDFQFGELPPSTTLPPGAQQAMLRVAQEALANIGRHGRAQHVSVALAAVGSGVELAIRDDGAGFDPNTSRRGMGISNMHARAADVGGTFEVASRPGEGTSVKFFVPRLERSRYGWNVRTLTALWMMAFLGLTVWKFSKATMTLMLIFSGVYSWAIWWYGNRKGAAR